MTRELPILLLAAVALTGCDLSMTRQAKHEAQSAPTWWPSGPDAAPAPEGTVSQSAPAEAVALAQPPHVTPALLQRGRERYTIFCAPCHGGAGEGNGIIVQRGFPRPPSLGEPRLMALPAAHTVDVITHGHGVMYSFGERVEAPDRWAIAAYVKALQRAQHDVAPS